MTAQGQSHSLTFVQGHSDSTFSNNISSETAGPIEAKVYMEPPWDMGNENLFKVPGHIIMPIYGKNFKSQDMQFCEETTFIRSSEIIHV